MCPVAFHIELDTRAPLPDGIFKHISTFITIIHLAQRGTDLATIGRGDDDRSSSSPIYSITNRTKRPLGESRQHAVLRAVDFTLLLYSGLSVKMLANVLAGHTIRGLPFTRNVSGLQSCIMVASCLGSGAFAPRGRGPHHLIVMLRADFKARRR